MAKASPTQEWLWHRRLSHINFNYINLLPKKDVVIGLPKLKYVKDQLCSSCEVSKSKKKFIQDKGYSKFRRTVKFASYGLVLGKHLDGIHVTWARFGEEMKAKDMFQLRDHLFDAFTKSA
ncbi:retrovirus-related pol polyprotein from transposon TNT 1-94 [Tanacetum coccineum]